MNSVFEFELSKEDNLLKRFEEIHDFIYANDGLSPQQTLEEFIKVLFIKFFDENENLQQFSISSNEWNELKNGKIVTSLIDRVSNLFEKTKFAYKDVFDNDDRIKISAIALGFTINKLQNISLINSSHDAKGLAFQKFLTHHEKDGRGQFFTPEPVIDFCVEMMQPKQNEKIIDPACGSGGFLMSALKFLQKNTKNLNTKNTVAKNLFGLDINKSIARIAKMKLLLEANGNINILCTNSLEDLDTIKLSLSHSKGFDLILANPPFGAKITNTNLLSNLTLVINGQLKIMNFIKLKHYIQIKMLKSYLLKDACNS
jgi:type I restriction enzyme M protein